MICCVVGRYNDPYLEVPYELNISQFNKNPVVPMLYQLHGMQRCFESVMEYEEQHNVEYGIIIRARTDHEILALSENHTDFALYTRKSLSQVTIPWPAYDYSGLLPGTGGYQDRIGWGPSAYMHVYMSRWSQLFNKTHLDSNPPHHGESSLWWALRKADIPVGRVADNDIFCREVEHMEAECDQQIPVHFNISINVN